MRRALAVLVTWWTVSSPSFGATRANGFVGHRPQPKQHEASTEPASEDVLVIEDFERAEPGDRPPGWKARGWGSLEVIPYRVEQEGINRFLRAEDTGQNVVLYKRFRWRIQDYPYISWRWRIRAVPQGADERVEARADSAAGLYLMYGRKLGLIPRTIKFIWSGSLPAGSAFRRPGIGMPWTVVAGSGAEPDNAWHRVVFNALEAYRRTFGGTPPRRPLGVGVLSDANNTGTRAFADYDDIVVLRHAAQAQEIERLLSPH